MSNGASARTDTLLKIYLGLFAVSVVLCGVLAQRHIGSLSWLHRGDPFAGMTAGREPQHGYSPSINWGGAKR